MEQALTSMEQTNFNRIRNNLDTWIPEFAALGARDLVAPESQESWIRKVNMLNGLFQGIENKAHPQVRQALVDFKGLVDAVNAKILEARKSASTQAVDYASAEARAEEIYALYADLGTLSLPAEAERISEWVGRAETMLAFLPKAQAMLADFSANAPNPRAFESNERYYRVEMPAKLAAMMSETGRNLAGRIEQMNWMLDFVAATDPAEESHVMNRLRGENVDEKLREIRALAAEAKALVPLESKLLPGQAVLAGLAAKLDLAGAEYTQKAEVAVASVRMPEDRYEFELSAEAKRLLSEKGFGEPKRLVVNYGPNDKVSSSVRIEGEWIVTYKLAWTEFQAVSAEAEDGAFYLYYNDFTRYSMGDPSTVLDKWLFTGRFKGPKILEQNIEG